MRHFTIWCVWITGVITLIFALFYFVLRLMTSMDIIDVVNLGDIYNVTSVVSQLAHGAFTLSLLLHMQAVYNDLFKLERSIDHARYSVAPLPETIVREDMKQ